MTKPPPAKHTIGGTDAGLVDHLGVDLWRAFRSYELAMFERVSAEGFEDITVADGDVLIHIVQSGTPLAEISQRRGLTKQAVHERVHSLVNREYLELKASPVDKRIKIVCLTKRGAKLVSALKRTKLALHEEIAASLGAKGMVALRNMLAEVEAVSSGTR